MNNTIIFSKILSGISKTLSIASKIIPVYQDTAPVLKNIPNIYSKINNKPITISKEEPIKKEPVTNNGPQFFI